MPNTKQDRSTVSQKQKYEFYDVCKKYKLKAKFVRPITFEIGHNGKPEHSRRLIELALEERGYYPKGVFLIQLPDTGEYSATLNENTVTAPTKEEAVRRLKEITTVNK